MMNILTTGMGWIDIQHGGLNRYFADYMRAMKEYGHAELGFVVAPQGARLKTDLNIINTTEEASNNYLLSRMRSVRKRSFQALGSFQPDVYNPHFALYSAMVTRSRIPSHVPIVTHFQGPWALESKVEEKKQSGAIIEARYWLKKQVEQLSYRRSDSFIVLSEYFRNMLVENYGVGERDVHIIPGAVDHERFRPHPNREQLRTQLGICPNQPLLFCIRRLVRRMGIDRLIHAMVDVVRQHPDTQLFIGGDGPMRAEYEALIHQLGLSSNVKLLGRISNEELVQYYQAADISVVPTLTLEGFGLITVESLACGTPVLGTPYGGTKEILQQLSDDLLFKDGTSESMSQKIIDVLNKNSYLPTRETCREHVLKRYTWNRVAGAVTELFTEEIDKRKVLRK
ncbi:glycosyltransferase family 4 protein [Paenibacillus sp. N3/727]|uniref:glycosyltransferase family 4 protein n=1 Tax=Paenibacillus sp. N3/727 TaxID=2925845 RepID=UPI001F531E99|nr:glycosyltransferase family 4 protein [Paenibacillus sp. N3/727]UNK18767.1 glycosyltransferase family 4 protein [Paenibacillus sp. N3/727]